MDTTPLPSAQLVQYLGWLTPLILTFALLEGITSVVFRDLGSGIVGTTLFAYGCSLLVARTQARRERQHAALIIVCGGFLLATLIVVVAQPNLLPILVLAPFLAVGVALPYASERSLRLLFVVSWLATVVVTILGEVLPPRSTLPAWYEASFHVAALAAAVAVVLLLLWQFRSRLMGAVAQARAAEGQALYDATHDALTGLPNRSLFVNRLRHTLQRARRDEQYLFAILFLDLDRFKNVNDSLGHNTGDLLLVETARRLETCVRPTDTLARLGGDEFTILLEDIENPEGAVRVAERVQEKLRTPFALNGHELYLTASIGIVSKPADYHKPEDLLRDADTAMYRAKDGGKARYEVFDVEMRARAVRLLRLETDLRHAVEHREFVVHYQPIVSLRSGRIVALEALVRWEHPKRGLLPPAEFIPLAEETDLIVPIGLSVLREACRTVSRWRATFPDRRPLDVSVNLSSSQLAQPELAEYVGSIIDETGLQGRHLRLEITESTIMQDTVQAIEALSSLRRQGVRVYVDDFGTGYSSLASLHRLPVDVLKIDRSFVGRLDTGSDSMEVVQTIATLAHSLGLDVIAEGVETAEQLRRLREIGCEYGQGYYFSRPLDFGRVEMIISAESWKVSPPNLLSPTLYDSAPTRRTNPAPPAS